MDNLKAIFEQKKLNNQASSVAMPKAFTDKFSDMKAEKAEKLFRRYLEAVVAVLLPKLPFLQDGTTHISLDGIMNRCGDFQYKKQRYWIWNEFKNIYPFIVVEALGSNLKVADSFFEKNTKVRIVNERLLHMLLHEKSPETIFWHFYTQEDVQVADAVAIDMDNLERYIGCTEMELEASTTPNHRAKLQANLIQAKLIYKIGEYTADEIGQAALPMVPSPSAFGRTYYKGINIQNVSKQVRSAIIGQHYQYDMNAAVFAVKLYLYGIIKGSDNNLVGSSDGTYTRQYLAEKSAIRNRLARECFNGIDIPFDAKVKSIKNALTAIGFGAKVSGRTWMTDEGLKGTALTEILTSVEVRDRFLSDRFVKAFLEEQRIIEDAILTHAESDPGYDAMCDVIKASNGANGKVTRAGKLAFMYQHHETEIMDCAAAVLAHYGIEIIARIHDAFVVRQKVPAKVMDDISAAWGLRDYLSLDSEEVKAWIDPAFKRALREAKADEAAHVSRMATAEKQAAIYRFNKAAAGR